MKQFTKKNLPGLRNDIDAALANIAKKHGINLHAGNARFTSDTVTFKLEATVNGEGGVTRNKEAIALEKYFPALVGTETVLNGDMHTVVGFKSRASKLAFIVENNQTGGKLLTTHSQLGL